MPKQGVMYVWATPVDTFTVAATTTASHRPHPSLLLTPTSTTVVFPVDEINLTASTAPDVVFEDRASLLLHYRSDWHRYNLRQKLHSKPLVSLATFEQRIARTDGNDSGSSLSGSGSEDEDEDKDKESSDTKTTNTVAKTTSNMQTLVRAFDGKRFAMWSCATLPSNLDPLAVFQHKPLRWIILLYTSGHFSAAVFVNGIKQTSKTIHRYTTRRKQGGSQARHDSGGGGPAKSAGSQIRRHNEIMLAKEVHHLLREEWKQHMSEADVIFLSCTKRNADIFFGKNTQGTKGICAIQKSDPRVKRVPFQTKRPTLRETLRVCELLGRLYLVEEEMKEGGKEEQSTSKTKKKKKKKKKKKSKAKGNNSGLEETIQTIQTKQEKDKIDDDEQNKEEHVEDIIPDIHSVERRHLFQLLENTTDVTEVLDYVQMLKTLKTLDGGDDKCSNVLNARDPTTGEMCLHFAVRHVRAKDIIPVLLSLGANPTVKDCKRRTPFKIGIVIEAKEARNAFRRYMSEFPQQYDWQASGVLLAGGLTKEDDAKRAAKKKESRKRARERKKVRKAESEVENELLNRAVEEEKSKRDVVMDVQMQMRMARIASTVAMELNWFEGELLTAISSSPEDSLAALTAMQRMLNMGEDPSMVIAKMLSGSLTVVPTNSMIRVEKAGRVVVLPQEQQEQQSQVKNDASTRADRRARAAAAAEARMKR